MSWEYPQKVALFDPPDPEAEVDPYDPADGPWWVKLMESVPANLQPLTGSVEQLAAGRQVNADWEGFFPPDVAVEENQGVEVLEGPAAGWRFRIVQVGPLGDDWDTELLLKKTEEVFRVEA